MGWRSAWDEVEVVFVPTTCQLDRVPGERHFDVRSAAGQFREVALVMTATSASILKVVERSIGNRAVGPPVEEDLDVRVVLPCDPAAASRRRAGSSTAISWWPRRGSRTNA